MNDGGVPYSISNPPGSTRNWIGTPGKYSTDFHTNVKGSVDHFDVYGEVHTMYSQVYWTRNNPINLPSELVSRFEGKMQDVGMEGRVYPQHAYNKRIKRNKNNSTLPIPKPSSGLRLPPDRFCLTSCNFKLRSSKRQPPPRPGPYYYGSTPMATSAAVSLRPKMPYTIVNNPSTPMHPMSRPILKTTPNKIQLQPASTGGPTVYTMTINPNSK